MMDKEEFIDAINKFTKTAFTEDGKEELPIHFAGELAKKYMNKLQKDLIEELTDIPNGSSIFLMTLSKLNAFIDCLIASNLISNGVPVENIQKGMYAFVDRLSELMKDMFDDEDSMIKTKLD